MARLRRRQKEEIIRQTLARVSPAVAGTAPGPVSGVASFNGRTGNVVSTVGDIPAHHTTHENGGSDQINVGGLLGVLTNPQPPIIGSTATTAVAGNDARLTDARTPLAHHTTHESGGSDQVTLTEAQITNLVADLAARVLSTDSRLSDIRPGKYDVGTLSLATDQFLIQDRHLYLSGSERLTLPGTAEMLLTDLGNTQTVVFGTPKTPALSFIVPTDYFHHQLFRLAMANQQRASLQGNADLIITDAFQTRSRIVLAGMG